MAAVTVSDFFIASKIYTSEKATKRKLFMILSIAINLGMLSYFKYTNFLCDTFANLVNCKFNHLDIFLPIGISFFTFQSLSYTIDIYRKEITPLKNITDYAFYLSFFPQLVAGPIVRARDFIPQIHKPLEITKEMFGTGLFYIISGLFKKAVISDYISTNFVDRIFDNPSLYSGIENLLGVYGYALQIYCDFSGYSDMAIGIALFMGFHFNKNFDSPYKSKSITDFWHRWHISLSNWLRDYLYISLGGNRKGKLRQYVNLMVTMFLGGLWHGASWNFVLWGSLHGIALSIDKYIKSYPLTNSVISKSTIYRYLGTFITFNFVCFCWIFFRNIEFSSSIDMLKQIFTSLNIRILPELLASYWKVFLLMIIGYSLHFVPDRIEQTIIGKITDTRLIWKACILMITIYIVIQMKSAEVQPFIYFQF